MGNNSTPEMFCTLRAIDRDKKKLYIVKIIPCQIKNLEFNEEEIYSACIYHNYKNQIRDFDKREKN